MAKKAKRAKRDPDEAREWTREDFKNARRIADGPEAMSQALREMSEQRKAAKRKGVV